MSAIHPLVDTHAHLDGERFAGEVEAVIARAAAAGVSRILTVGCDLASSRASVALAEAHAEIYAAVGIHPHDALTVDAAALEELRRAGRPPPGGGDRRNRPRLLPRPRPPHRPASGLRAQIRLARELGKPLIVHDRDAHDEILATLREKRAAEAGGVLHCFSGDLAMARACLELGFYLSIAGPVTYPKNEELREVVRAVSVDRLLVETDCPYLAPQSAGAASATSRPWCAETAAKVAADQGADPRRRGAGDDPQRLHPLRHRRGRPDHAHRLHHPQLPLPQHHQPLHQRLYLLRQVQGLHRQGSPPAPGARTFHQPR